MSRLATLIAAIIVALVSPMLGSAPATAHGVTVTFRQVQVTGDDVSIKYTVNVRPSYITGRVCTLNDGDSRVRVSCGRLPSTGWPTRVQLTLRDVPEGDNTYTVKIFHRGRLVGRRTTSPFTVGSGLLLDQSNTDVAAHVAGAVGPTCDAVVGVERAQTFTAGRDGQLRRVSLIATRAGGIGDLVVNITGVTTGAPDGPVLGTGTYAGPGSPDDVTFVDIPLTSPADLTQGQQYAIVLTVLDPGDCSPDAYWTVIGGEDSYPSGTAQVRFGASDPWLDSPDDLGFKTWMAP
jgi:hypothetical protein